VSYHLTYIRPQPAPWLGVELLCAGTSGAGGPDAREVVVPGC